MPLYFPPLIDSGGRVMLFVDGENLAIRFGHMKGKGRILPRYVHHREDVYVWSDGLTKICGQHNVIRKYFYTSLLGDNDLRLEVADELKAIGFEAPRVFPKSKTKGSKRVDICLATDMLSHAFRGNYTTAVLVAGDEDYVPLVEAVQAEGCRVLLWFIDDGLSPHLKRTADFYANIATVMGIGK